MTANLEEQIRQAARLISSARHAVALTGAGISTPSGIPDFRSPGTGEWARVNPMEVVSLTTFHQRPQRFYNWFRPVAKIMAAAEPNPAHLALAELEKRGFLHALLTQNIDGLHQKAGSTNVIELHGSLKTLTCLKCRRSYDSEQFWPVFFNDGFVPHCPVCEATLKPDIIFFEEMLHPSAWNAAVKEASNADVMIIVGTSLEVGPVNGLPHFVLDHRGKIIINTLSNTYLDDQAEILLNCEVSYALPAIVCAILKE